MEETVVNNEVKETPQAEPTQPVQTEATPTPSGEVVKETPKESTDKVPYSRFSEVIKEKNTLKGKIQEYENKLKEYEQPKPRVSEEQDPFASLTPEEREQTEKFIDKFVKPKILNELKPFMQEVQAEKINKQVTEAKNLASKVGINFDERLPEVVDFLSRPENRGRLTAKEALLSLYGEEILEKTRSKARDEISAETKELMEKKKIANTQIPSINPNVVIQSSDAAKANMNKHERLDYDIRKAIEAAKQGVKNPKVRE